MFIVHGWRETENFTWMHQTKDAILAVVSTTFNFHMITYSIGKEGDK